MSAPDLPGYRFVEHLGSGGFADVFCYEQQWPRQKVAVKVVRPDVDLDDRERALFTSEANAMARLGDHPNIVPVLTAGETADGRPFLVMRFCPPPDLGVRVRSSPMAVADAISTGIKLASAIETAHRVGTVHRDIKPSNVLVTSYHEPALTDFGIAGRLQEVAADHEVRISYPWSPPEMLDGRSNGSIASDVYSLGATIWHLLVGRSPFSIPGGDNSTRALTARILHAAAPATQRADVPPALDRLLQQTMSKQPSHRPESAMDLARGLQRIEAQLGFPRTAIAVEGDQPASMRGPLNTVHGSPDPEATRMKPPTVVSGSAPRAVLTEPPVPRSETPVTTAPEPVRRGVLAAVVAGTAAVLAVVAFLVVGGGEDDRPDVTPSPNASSPLDVVADPPTGSPRVEGRRVDDGVRFTWTAPDVKPGDDWEWSRSDSGETGRVSATELVLEVAAGTRVCLQVRQIRASAAGEYGEGCVG